MRCERSDTTMTLLLLGYLVRSLGNRAMTLFTETSLMVGYVFDLCEDELFCDASDQSKGMRFNPCRRPFLLPASSSSCLDSTITLLNFFCLLAPCEPNPCPGRTQDPLKPQVEWQQPAMSRVPPHTAHTWRKPSVCTKPCCVVYNAFASTRFHFLRGASIYQSSSFASHSQHS